MVLRRGPRAVRALARGDARALVLERSVLEARHARGGTRGPEDGVRAPLTYVASFSSRMRWSLAGNEIQRVPPGRSRRCTARVAREHEAECPVLLLVFQVL